MPSHYAALLVIGLLVLIGGPALYWVFFKMDSQPDNSQSPSEPVAPLTDSDITRIESELEVVLPIDLRAFLVSERDEFDPDNGSVLSDPESIIEMTREFRSGSVGLPPWPKNWVYIGDESDGCPYYIDCPNGKFTRLHMGNLRQKPLAIYENFTAYWEETRKEREFEFEADKEPLTWKDTVSFYTPVAVAMVIIFIVIPMTLFGLSSLLKWLLN